MSVEFNDAEVRAMRQFYEAELMQTLARYQHLQSVLAKLGVDTPNLPSSTPAATAPVSPAPVSAVPPAKPKVRRKRKGKRGRKSIWGDFILKTLRKLDRPVLYSELVRMAQIQFNIKEDKIKDLKAAINQSAFRLRTIHGKIDTIGAEGKKEKHVALKTWFDDNGDLKKEYVARMGKTA